MASEDPFLTGEIGTNYAVGFQQGSDARYLLGVLTLKHWAAYTVRYSVASDSPVLWFCSALVKLCLAPFVGVARFVTRFG